MMWYFIICGDGSGIKYINLPFKYKEEHEWVTDFQKNNAYFLDHINGITVSVDYQ